VSVPEPRDSEPETGDSDRGERDVLIERVAGSYRARDADGRIVPDPAWYDLDEAGRREAFERALVDRRLEAALDPDGLSTTERALLARIRRGQG